MIRRLALLLVVAAPFGLLMVFGPPRRAAPSSPDANFDLPTADTPIVAIRGQPLAEHEEPLPPGARVRFGSTRFRHPKGLGRWQAKIAGPYFLSEEDGGLTLTEITTGRRVWKYPSRPGGDDLELDRIEASADGRIVAWSFGSAPKNRIVARVSEAVTDPAQPIRLVTALRLPPMTENDFVEAVFFPEDRSEVWVLAGGIHAFDAKTGQHLRHVRTKNCILAMDRRGTRFLTSSARDPRFVISDGFISYHRVRTYGFRPRSEPAPAKQTVRQRRGFAPAADPDAETEPIDLIVANARTGESMFAITIFRKRWNEVCHLDLSPDGRYLSYEADSILTVLDVDRKRPVLELDTCEGESGSRRRLVSESWFSDDGGRFTVTGPGIVDTQFDLATSLEVTKQGEPPLNGRWLGLGRRGPVVSEHGVLRRPTGEPPPPGYADAVFAYSLDQRLIAIGGAAGRLDVWHQDGRLVKTLCTSGKRITAIGFGASSRRLAACDRGRAVRVWTVSNWRECERFDVPADHDDLYPEHLVFSTDGRQLLVSRVDVAALWDFDSRGWVWDAPGYYRLSRSSPPVFDPDGSRILFPGDCAWIDAQTGKTIAAFADMNREVVRWYRWDYEPDDSALAISPDGSAIARVNDERLLRVDANVSGPTFQSFSESEKIRKRHSVLRFSPDGRRLVTCDDNGHAHVWEIASGQLAFTLNYPDGAIHDVHFGNDGRTLITSNHREVIVWDLLELREPVTDPWTDLGHDAPRAEQARRAILANPDAAVDMLRVKLRPAALLSETDIGRLIRSLDADDYRSREQAAAGLLVAGRRVLPSLKAAKLTSPEGIARQAALEQRFAAGLTPNELRQVRGIEVLEQINTPAAHKLIDQLTTGDPAAVVTEEAKKSIQVSHLSTGADLAGHDGNSSKSRARKSVTASRPVITPSLANTTYSPVPMTTPTGKDRVSPSR